MVYRHNKSIDYFEDLEVEYLTKPEVDERDYKPYITKIGYLDEKTIPVYGYIRFAFTPWTIPHHIFVDNKGREVLLFIGSEGDPNTNSYFKAYRYASSETFIFENEPLHPPFLLSNQRIDYIEYVCSDYIVARIKTIDTTTTYKTYIIKTNANYDETTWQLMSNLTDTIGFNAGGSKSYSCCIDVTYNKLYVIKCIDNNSNLTVWGRIVLYMYDLNTLSFINSYELFSMYTDTDISKYPIDSRTLNYSGLQCAFNYNNGELLIHLQCIIYFWIQSNLRTFWVRSFVVSVKLDDIMRNNGTSSFSYLIPRDPINYNFFESCKGVYTGYGGSVYSMCFDKYNNILYLITASWFGDVGFGIRAINFSNINDTNQMIYSYPYQARYIIDSCPYAKQNYRSGYFIDDYIITNGQSQKYGVATYISKINMLSDKIDLLPGQWRLLANINPNPSIPITDRHRWFVYKSGTNISHYIHDDSFRVYKINIGSNFDISYTDIGITLPLPPSSLYIRRNTWGYDFNTNTVYWLCTDRNDSGRSVVVWTSDNGTTWNKSPRVNESEANSSATSFGDGVARYSQSNNGFIENGLFYSATSFSTVGGATGGHINSYNKDTNTVTVHNIVLNPYYDRLGRFGWHPVHGYYAGINWESWRQWVYFNTNLQNFLNNSGQTVRYMYTVPSSGLAATIVNFPVYMNGRLYYLPNIDVALNPNTDNYIYAVLNGNSLDVYVDTVVLSNTSQRILLAKVTTNITDPVSQELYQVKEISLPDYYDHKTVKIRDIPITAGGEIDYDITQLGFNDFDNIAYSIYRKDSTYYYLDDTFTVTVSSNLSQLYIKSNYTTDQVISLVIIQ